VKKKNSRNVVKQWMTPVCHCITKWIFGCVAKRIRPDL